jgi:hypothetical protein
MALQAPFIGLANQVPFVSGFRLTAEDEKRPQEHSGCRL